MKVPSIINNIRIFVHTPSGNIVTLNKVSAKTTIHELKLELEIKSGMLAEIQNILFSNVKLHHSKSLLESNVINGSVLRLKAKEGSLEQIYINAVKGGTREVFKLGVEYINLCTICTLKRAQNVVAPLQPILTLNFMERLQVWLYI